MRYNSCNPRGCLVLLLTLSNYVSITKALNLVVISPAGGVGEAAVVSAAKRGNQVNWFILQKDQEQRKISLSEEVFSSIKSAGGSVELTGSSVKNMIDSGDNAARAAFGKWCSGVAVKANSEGTAIICTADDINESSSGSEGSEVYQAVCCATKEACKALGESCQRKLAILGKDDATMSSTQNGIDEGVGFLGSFFGENDDETAAGVSLVQAIGNDAIVLQHGELFGQPGAPAFVGGPRRDPILREEYILRGVRMDPVIANADDDSVIIRSSRLSVGEAAALIVCNNLSNGATSPLFLTSLRGEGLSDEEWETEINRAIESASVTGILFQSEFSAVPSIRRLADWLATKWFPAILKTFELATIQTGARPVYATVPYEGTVEIVWQQLKEFKSTNVGKLIITVDEKSITARREIFEENVYELPGDKVLVRRLADATAQAMEKGLAIKPKVQKRSESKVPKIAIETVSPVKTTTATSAGTVEDEASGPRGSGARRSSPRARGRKRRSDTPAESSVEEGSDDVSSWQ